MKRKTWKPVGQKDMQRRLGGFENFCADLYEQNRLRNICRNKFPADLWEDAYQYAVMKATERYLEMRKTFTKAPIIDDGARGMTAGFICLVAKSWVWNQLSRRQRVLTESDCRHTPQQEKWGYFDCMPGKGPIPGEHLDERIDPSLVAGIQRACDRLPVQRSRTQRERAKRIVNIFAQSANDDEGIGVDEYVDLPALKQNGVKGQRTSIIHHDNTQVARQRILANLAEISDVKGDAYQQSKADVSFLRQATYHAIAERREVMP
jgi:hypothetical protein